MASAPWRPAALAALLAAAAAGVGCQGILGIEDPRDTESDAAGSTMSNVSAPWIDGAPARNRDAVRDGDVGPTEDGNVDASASANVGASEGASVDASASANVDASEGASVDASGEDSESNGLDAPASQGDAAPNPCANISGVANGNYCGSDSQFMFDTSQADPNTLYDCSNGLTLAAVVCPDGCQTNVLSDDDCNP